MSEEGAKKTVSIRGIDERLYKQISMIARESGKTVGEIINEAMRMLLEAVTKVSDIGKSFMEGLREATEVYEVRGIDELTINKTDLETIDKPIVFKNIKKLEIADDVPYELFEKKIRYIVLCDELIIPKNYPKLKVAQKCRLVKKITAK